MIFEKQPTGKELITQKEITWEESLENGKKIAFEIINTHLKENINTQPYLYYLLLIVQHLSLLGFVIHPLLNIYGENVALLSAARTLIGIINFHEFLRVNSSWYGRLIVLISIIILTQILLLVISSLSTLKKWKWQYFGLFRKITNFVFLLVVRALSGPFLAVCVSVIYCTNNLYHTNLECYTEEYIIIVSFSCLLALVLVTEILIFGLFYYIKNPLVSSYLAQKNHYYFLSKSLIKLIFPLYYAFDYTLQLTIQFAFIAAALWLAYLFWHRFNSHHSYHPNHYRFEYFLETIILWVSIMNIIYYFAAQNPIIITFTFVYAILEGMILGLILIATEKKLEQLFLRNCVKKKCKKQEIEPFFVVLISQFVHQADQKAYIFFNLYSKLLIKEKQVMRSILQHQEKKQQQEEVSKIELKNKQIKNFLFVFLKDLLKEKSTFLLKYIECQLFNEMGKKFFAMYKILVLSQTKNTLIQQFFLFQLTQSIQIDDDIQDSQSKRDFLKVYNFYRESELFQQLIVTSVQNSFQYWEELSEAEPSLSRVCGLAIRHSIAEKKIFQQHEKMTQCFPKSPKIAQIYLQYLFTVGINERELKNAKEMEESTRKINLNNNFDEQKALTKNIKDSIVTVGAIGNDLGVIFNCNRQAGLLLNYDSDALQGKNISKMMPQFFAKVHHLFMINFIERNQHVTLPIPKIVPALNKEFLLVQVFARFKLMYFTNGEMIFVAILKKESNGKGFLMFEESTLQVLGIDPFLMTLMNGKLSGLQVIREDIKLNVLFPDLDVEELIRTQEGTTVLDINCLDDKMRYEPQTRKSVYLKIKRTFQFQSIKLGILEIEENSIASDFLNFVRYQATDKERPSVRNTEYGAARRNARVNKPYKVNFPESQEVPFPSISRIDRVRQQKQYQDNLLTAEIIQFQSSKQESKMAIIGILIIFCALITSSLLISDYNGHYTNFTQIATNCYDLTNQTFTILHSEANICLFVQRLLKISQTGDLSPDNKDLSDLKEHLLEMTVSLVKSKEYMDQQPQDKNYSYYQPIKVRLFKIVNETLYQEEILSMRGFQALFLYISAAEKFMVQLINNPNPSPEKFLYLRQQALYIQLNGQKNLPDMSSNAIYSFKQEIMLRADDTLINILISKLIFLFTLFFFLTLLLILAFSVNRTNESILQIIRNIKLQQTQYLMEKCATFLQEKDHTFQRRKSKCLMEKNININQLLQTKKQIKEPGQKNMKTSIIKQEIQKDKMKEEEKVSQYESEFNQNLEGEESLLRNNNSDKTINLFFTFSTKKMLLIAILALAIIISIDFASAKFSSGIINAYAEFFEEYRKVGKLRKSLQFLNYFSFRVIDDPNDTLAREFLNTEIKQFLTIQDLSQSLLKTLEPIFSRVYSIIQTLQQWLSIPNIPAGSILMANYTKINEGLTWGDDYLISTNQKFLNENLVRMNSDSNQIKLIIILTKILSVTFLLIYFFKQFLFKAVNDNSKFLNLLKMIPTKLVRQNLKIRQRIFTRKKSIIV